MWTAAACLLARVAGRHSAWASRRRACTSGAVGTVARSGTRGLVAAAAAGASSSLAAARQALGGSSAGAGTPREAATATATAGVVVRPGPVSGESAAAPRRLPPNLRRVTSTDLDAWARGPAVLGHAHSRPSCEPYALSAVREMGRGAEVPEDWSVRLLSAAGMKGRESPNQDAFSYTVLDNGWIVCVACDGHGEQGEVISERVARMIPFFLSLHLPALSLDEALPRAFAQAQTDLERCFSSAQAYSGTTVAACCIHGERHEAWFAHAGDSRAVLGDLVSSTPLFVTEEHKAHDPGEHQRLEEAGAQVITKRYEDGELVSRIFIPKTGIPGLAMSRSLGDGCLKKYGVIAEPEVRNVSNLWERSTAPFVVLASDGLWDAITAEHTVSELAGRRRQGLDVLLGAEALLRRSQRLWIEAEGDYCDDVTVLLVVPSSGLVANPEDVEIEDATMEVM